MAGNQGKTRLERLRDVLAAAKGATPITLQAETEVKLTGGKKCPLIVEGGPVTKLARVNGMVNFHYEAAVNRQRTREEIIADFVASKRQWGARLVLAGDRLTPLVTNVRLADESVRSVFLEDIASMDPETLYAEVKVEKSLGHVYLQNGIVVPDDKVEPYLPKRSESRQGVEREIILRDYSLSSLKELVLAGKVY